MAAPQRRGPQPLEARFSRAQVEWALWRAIASEPEREPSSVFRVRIKQLLDLDRSKGAADGGAGVADFAFSDTSPGGQGQHSAFSAFDAVFLHLGLSLLDAGFKRAEVVALLRQLRQPLMPTLVKRLRARGIAIGKGQRLFDDLDPLAPEHRLALLLPRVEDPDVSEGLLAGGGRLVLGMPNILDAVERMFLDSLILIDVGAAAYLLPSLLMQAPAARRGRRRS